MRENTVLKLCREIVAKKTHRVAFLDKVSFPVSPLEIYHAFNLWEPQDGQTMLMIQHERNFECYVGGIRGEDVPRAKVARQGDNVKIIDCQDGTTIECPLSLISFKHSELYTQKPPEEDK